MLVYYLNISVSRYLAFTGIFVEKNDATVLEVLFFSLLTFAEGFI